VDSGLQHSCTVTFTVTATVICWLALGAKQQFTLSTTGWNNSNLVTMTAADTWLQALTFSGGIQSNARVFLKRRRSCAIQMTLETHQTPESHCWHQLKRVCVQPRQLCCQHDTAHIYCWASCCSVGCGATAAGRPASAAVDRHILHVLTFILISTSIPSPPHSFITGLKPSFSANPSHRSLPFLLQDWLQDSPDCLLLLLSISGFTF